MRKGGGVPESAGGYSESCPVIRCRQTGWELWSLAWSMLQQKETSVYMLLYIHTYQACFGLFITDASVIILPQGFMLRYTNKLSGGRQSGLTGMAPI